MRRPATVVRLLLAIAFVALPGLALAQSTTGSITGTVVGPDGGPLPGVVVAAPARCQRQRVLLLDCDARVARLNPPEALDNTGDVRVGP